MSKGSVSPGEDVVLKSFLQFFRHIGREVPPPGDIRWPDKENRNSKDIDVLAGVWAIEHTSIDTIEGQRLDSAAFMEAAADLEAEIAHLFKTAIVISIPMSVSSRLRSREKCKAALRKWLITGGSGLTQKRKEISGISDIPFSFFAWLNPVLSPGVHFQRHFSGDYLLSQRVDTLIRRKAAKLQPYRQKGKIGIILLECEDIALMNEFVLQDAVTEAFPTGFRPQFLDELWLVQTGLQGMPMFYSIEDYVARGSNEYTSFQEKVRWANMSFRRHESR